MGNDGKIDYLLMLRASYIFTMFVKGNILFYEWRIKVWSEEWIIKKMTEYDEDHKCNLVKMKSSKLWSSANEVQYKKNRLVERFKSQRSTFEYHSTRKLRGDESWPLYT